MKIRIIGTCGSGKSFLAKEITEKTGIKKYDLDNIFWVKKYTKRRSDNEIKKLLEKISKKKKWIIEGMHYGITENIEKKSDLIVWINPQWNKIFWRLIKRFFNRKGKPGESVKDTIRLLNWMTRYKINIFSKSKKAHKNIFKKYSDKSIILKNKNEINKFLKKLK